MSGARMSLVVATVLTASAGSCSSAPDDQLVVLAASSLTDAFDRIEVDFEEAHPGVDMVISYAGSSLLVAQIADGAPADVLATADTVTMDRVGGVAEGATVFARNSMVIAVEAGNPLGIATLADLDEVPVLVLAAADVPAGAYARDVLACAGVEPTVRSFEQNVRAAAAKVALGEADAAIVYRTDIGDGLAAVEIDTACNVEADYPIVAMSDRVLAREFVDHVVGDAGRAALVDAGFEVP